MAHLTAEWTTQQFREVLADPDPYEFVIHDRDSIFSPSLDLTLSLRKSGLMSHIVGSYSGLAIALW